jgi:hypothetical protein
MPIPSRTIVIANANTITANLDVTTNVPEWATAFHGFCSVGTVSGTTPTLDIEIYNMVRTPLSTDSRSLSASDDTLANLTALPFGKLKQMTTTNWIQQFSCVGGGNFITASPSTSLALPTAGTFNNGPIGAFWKVTFRVGGTNPSFGTVKMVVQFIP